MHDSVRFHSQFRYVVPLSPMVNPGWCTRLFGLELSSVLYRTVFLYLDNDVVCMSFLYLGLEILHQKEGLITTAECKRIGSALYYDRHKVVVQIIVAKSIGESLKICEICKQYWLLGDYSEMQFKGVSVCDLCIIYSKFVQFSMKW